MSYHSSDSASLVAATRAETRRIMERQIMEREQVHSGVLGVRRCATDTSLNLSAGETKLPGGTPPRKSSCTCAWQSIGCTAPHVVQAPALMSLWVSFRPPENQREKEDAAQVEEENGQVAIPH